MTKNIDTLSTFLHFKQSHIKRTANGFFTPIYCGLVKMMKPMFLWSWFASMLASSLLTLQLWRFKVQSSWHLWAIWSKPSSVSCNTKMVQI